MQTPVSVVLPTYQERTAIRDCLASLQRQDYHNIDEILIVDGGSTDGTLDIVARIMASDPRVRLIHNPGRTAAAAMNLGMREASCNTIVRVDAHTWYRPDYVTRSVSVFESSGAQMVGGPMRPRGTNSFARAVAAVTSSRVGMGPGRFHYAAQAQDVDTVYLGTFDRRVISAVGGYDAVNLQWAAEDQELNYRLRKAGHRIRIDPTISSIYFPRDTPRALARQYHNYGMCKASTLRKHGSLPSWRPLAPAALVASTAAGLVVGIAFRKPGLAMAPPAMWGAVAAAAALRFGSEREVTPHRALGAIAICHWAYGAGFWRGVGRIVTGRGFDSMPGGRR
jgi:succinoglycan biosynthesis protein ExoA